MQPGAAAVAAMPVAAGGSVATLACAMSFNTELVPTIGQTQSATSIPAALSSQIAIDASYTRIGYQTTTRITTEVV